MVQEMAYLNCYLSKRTEVRVILVEKEKVLVLHDAPFQNVILLQIAYFSFWLINTDTFTQHVDAGEVVILTTLYTVQYTTLSIWACWLMNQLSGMDPGDLIGYVPLCVQPAHL